MTIYGSGLRVSEAVNIKVCDIDSEKMRIFVRKGKGGRDRYATLSQRALEELRSYWKIKRPKDFLFLTRENTNPTPKSVNNAFRGSMERACIKKKATVHTLRHCFATHLLESDTNLFHIKKLLGLKQNISLKLALEQVSTLGYQGKRSAFEAYCRKLIVELGISYTPKRNVAGIAVDPNRTKPTQHYVPKTDFMRYLWSGKELEDVDLNFIFDKHPKILEIQQCIIDFRKIYADKNVTLLEQFIERYSGSQSNPIKLFASGLRGDLKAVKNSVTSELSNGFVEGTNNKIKVIKRIMYGRAKIDLLRVKVLFAR